MNGNIGLFSRVCVYFERLSSKLMRAFIVSVVLLLSMALGVVYATDVSSVDQEAKLLDARKSGLVAANDKDKNKNDDDDKGKGKGKGKGSTTTTTCPPVSDNDDDDDDHGKGKGKGK